MTTCNSKCTPLLLQITFYDYIVVKPLRGSCPYYSTHIIVTFFNYCTMNNIQYL